MKVILARTLDEGRDLQRSGLAPADARVTSPLSRGCEGTRITELYVHLPALFEPYGVRMLSVLRRNQAKTPGARKEVILL